MKILYLTDNNSIHNRRFLEKLVAAGCEITYWDLTATKEYAENLPDGVQLISSSKRVERGACPQRFQQFLPQFQSVVAQLRPKLVHAGPIQSAGYLAALADFHPTLITSWGSDLLVDADRNPEWKQATDIALQKADAFFCDCDTVRKKANGFRTFTDSEVVQFPWGLKRGEFSPVGPQPPSNKFLRGAGTTIFIYTRSYDPLYGVDVLLDGFLRAWTVNRSLRLLLLGEGSQSQSIRDYVESNGLSGVVSLIGPQPAEDLPSWFRAADGYVSCAKSDGTSISLLEAMATGLPVVVTDIPSNGEWITEPKNGWLAARGSAQAVADKMLQVASLSGDERDAISERNRRIVAERADWDQNFPRLLKMYEKLANSSAREI